MKHRRHDRSERERETTCFLRLKRSIRGRKRRNFKTVLPSKRERGGGGVGISLAIDFSSSLLKNRQLKVAKTGP